MTNSSSGFQKSQSLAKQLDRAIDAANLPYFIPKESLVKLSDDTGYEPDVVVLDRSNLENEPRWERESIITAGRTIKLIVEVVSTNWQDDYLYKLADYQALSVQDYWITEHHHHHHYLGLGGRLYIGNPKQPTLSVYNLVEGEYEVQQFRGGDRIVSPQLGELLVTAEEIFRAGHKQETHN